jgi:hypothetical protein
MGIVSSTSESARKHRREVWLKIVAPIVMPFLGLIVLSILLAIAVGTGSLVGKQITTIMGILATVFILIPMAVLCLLPYLLLAASAVGVGALHANAKTPLQFVHRLTGKIAAQTKHHGPRLARPLVGLNVRLTRWEYIMRGWLRPALPHGKESTDE